MRLLQAISRIWLSLMLAVGLAGVLWRLDGNRMISVHTQALKPVIRSSDVVLVRRTTRIKPGQAVAFKQAGVKNYSIGQLYILDMASAQVTINTGQKFVVLPITAVLGRGVVILPSMARPLQLLSTWPGLIVCVYIPTILVLWGELQHLRRYYRSPYRLHH